MGKMKESNVSSQQKELRVLLANILIKDFKKIDRYLDSIDSKDRLSFLVKLLPFFMPKNEFVEESVSEQGGWSEYVKKALEEYKQKPEIPSPFICEEKGEEILSPKQAINLKA